MLYNTGWEEEQITLDVPFKPIVLVHDLQVTDEQEIKTKVCVKSGITSFAVCQECFFFFESLMHLCNTFLTNESFLFLKGELSTWETRHKFIQSSEFWNAC